MRKLTIIACLSTLLAAPIAAQADWKGNWLVGASTGMNWYDGEFDNTITIPAGTFAFNNGHTHDARGWMWGVLGGYQAMCDRWLLGAELNIDWENSSHTINNVFVSGTAAGNFNTTTTFKHDANVGLTARLGYEATCWLLPFVRLGIETSRDKADVQIGQVIDGQTVAAFSGSGSERNYRFIGGVGLELPIPTCAGLSVRAEYNYHSRGTNSHDGDFSNGLVAQANGGHHTHINTAKASVVYNFDI